MQCHEKEGQGKMTIYVVFTTSAYMFLDMSVKIDVGGERLIGAFKKKI